MSYGDGPSGGSVVGWSVVGIVVLSIFTLVGMLGCPQYRVYEQRLTGEAELARAQQNRQIAVNEAQAKMDAAHLLAQAEVERAKGVAQANKIVSDGLGGPEGYLRYLWITEGAGRHGEIVYLPSNGGIPIMEAGRTPILEAGKRPLGP